jgi:tRNA threonylcarbamoyladenosine biosynthesis protein TsaE
MIITTKSSKETKDLGKMLAQEIKNGPASTRGNAMSTRGGQVICLSGELGSGKTTFTQGFLQGLKVKGPYTSPTFVIMKKYESKVKSLPEMLRPPATMLQLRAGISKQAGQKSKVIYHIDAYRVNAKDILNLGWEEIIADNNIILVEWADRIKKIIPQNSLQINFKWISRNEREIIFENK